MKVTWDTLLKDEFDGIQYIIQWRKKGEQKGWRRGESSKQVYIIKNLTPETDYEVKVSALCDKVISPAEQTHACTGTLLILQEVLRSVLETQACSCLKRFSIFLYIFFMYFFFYIYFCVQMQIDALNLQKKANFFHLHIPPLYTPREVRKSECLIQSYVKTLFLWFRRFTTYFCLNCRTVCYHSK